jgi:hypothetical protein
VERTTRRYWTTLLLGISFVAVFVFGWGSIFVKLGEVEAMEAIRVAWLVAGLATWVTVAYLVAREKGRSFAWVVFVLFFAPLLLVLLFLPHATRRRTVLESRMLNVM